MRENLATLLDDFRRFDRGIAVVRYVGNRRRVTTYAEIARLAGRFAALLARRGIGPGDRVVLWAENGAEWIAAFYGIMLRGALAVPLDAFGSADFAARVTEDVKPKLAVGDAVLLGRLQVELAQLPMRGPGASIDGRDSEFPMLAFENWARSLPNEEAGPVAGLGPQTPLQILFTSGTTGEPKGIVHTHGNVLASVAPIEQGAKPYLSYERLFHPLRFLLTLPLSHVFGQMMGLWVPAMFAAEVHFESRLVAPRLIETIRKERISVLAAVPRVMALLKTDLEMALPDLAARVTEAQKTPPGTLAWRRWWQFRDVHRAFGLKFWALISGGGALAGPLERFWNALGFVVVQGYGMTETTALVTLNHPFHVAQGTIGKPLPGREVKLGPDGEVLVRGPMISSATWSGGELRRREDEWLATGDLAETEATGELRFLGRKSETIVTAAGVNVHPEDLEEAIEQEPAIAACAVVAMETPNGPEPCAVLVRRGGRGTKEQAAEAIERANARLAEFQQIRRWVFWPEPDFPRTSTGKIKRKAVAQWLAGVQAAWAGDAPAKLNGAGRGDWLLVLIAEIAGETPSGTDDALRLTEDLHLDSLGRVQLAAALEERVGVPPAEGAFEHARTLGELRSLVGGEAIREPGSSVSEQGPDTRDERIEIRAPESPAVSPETEPIVAKRGEQTNYLYPQWPWRWPVTWARTAYLELVAQPLVWLLAKPRVMRSKTVRAGAEPMLIVCNHVTAYDGPLVEYALPGRMRRRVAIAMSGEMLEDFRHFRNPERRPGQRRFLLFGPLAYVLVTALYNVFPLPRRRDFQRSFAHAGEALDHGFYVLVFPEGTRSEGELAPFRPGIGLLTKQSATAVLPVAIRGLGELKAGRQWFRSGTIEVRVGEPLRFGPEETESAITARLQTEVQRLLKG